VDVVDAIHQALELQRDNRDDEALRILLAAAELHEDEDLWGEIALSYTIRGYKRPDAQAQEDFVEAEKWAELPLTRVGLAGVAMRRKDYERAEALVGEALEMDPELAEGQVFLGELRLHQSRLPEALEILAKAVDLHPKSGAAYAVLAQALEAAGQGEFAGKALAEGLKLFPTNDRLLLEVARACVAAEDFEKAGRVLEQAVAANDANAEAWRRLAWIAAKNGDESKMIESLDRASGIDREGTLAWIAKENLKLPEGNA
jgi:tetratricopeptide (TPR) repeat protein